MCGRDLGFRGEGSQRVAAERCDNDRLKKRELPLQEARAGGDLSGLRITIIGRAALDHVEDEDIGALKSDQVEEKVEQLPSSTNKWASRRIFTRTRRLANE